MASPRGGSSRISVSDLTGHDIEDYPLARVLEGLEKAAEGHALKPESDPSNMQVVVDDIRRKVEVDGKGNVLGARDKSMVSGFRSLDERFGFLYPGLIFLEGPRQSGKSAFAVQLAQQVRQENPGVPVFYFAYGDSKLDVQLRFLTRLARIGKLDYIRGNFDLDALVSAGKKYLSFASGLYIVQGTRELTPDLMERLVLATLDEHYGGRRGETPRESSCLIIVDYIQAVPSPEGTAPSDKAIYVAEALKDIAKKLQVPLLVLYGNNVASGERTVARSSDFQVVVEKRESFDFAADVYMTLTPGPTRRDLPAAVQRANASLPRGERIPEDAEEVLRESVLHFVKNKHGSEGEEEMWYVPSLSRWYCPADLEGKATRA